MSEMVLSVKGLSKHFGGVMAVKNVDFSVSEGEILGIIGPNGAGKSTTFDLLTGLTKPSAGKVFFDGHDVTHRKPHQITALGVGRTFQKIRVFSGLSVLENAMIGAFARLNTVSAAVARAEEALAFVGLLGQRNRTASSLTLVDRKKLELARALCTEPKLLLVDELMCGLNAEETKESVDLLRHLNNDGITILLVEHVMDVINALSHRVMVLSYGVKIADGDPQAVMKDAQVVEAYLGGTV